MTGTDPLSLEIEELEGGVGRDVRMKVSDLVDRFLSLGFRELSEAERDVLAKAQLKRFISTEPLVTSDEMELEDLENLGPDLVISYHDRGDADKLYAKRNAAMNLVEAALGAAKLGEWAACETGLGTVDIIFEVTDAAKAKTLAEATLSGTEYADYASLEIISH